MATIVKQMVAFGVALALLIVWSNCLCRRRKPGRLFTGSFQSRGLGHSGRSIRAAANRGYRQPQNRCSRGAAGDLLGLAAGSTALLTAKSGNCGGYQFSSSFPM